MVKMIRTDFRKIFGSYQIYLCMVILGFVYSLAYFEMVRGQEYYGDFANGFNVLSGSTIMIFCFLICIVGGSFLYCAEEKYGYLKYEIQRVGIKKYTVSKILSSVVSGFFTAMAGILISIGFMILVSCLKYENIAEVWPNANNLERFLWEIILFSMLCGLLSAIGFLVTTFWANIYIEITVPIIIYYFLLCLRNWIPIPMSLQISKVYLQVGYVDEGYIYFFLYAVLYTSFWLVFIYKIAKNRIQWRLEHA